MIMNTMYLLVSYKIYFSRDISSKLSGRHLQTDKVGIWHQKYKDDILLCRLGNEMSYKISREK